MSDKIARSAHTCADVRKIEFSEIYNYQLVHNNIMSNMMCQQ